jgi:uncharacterized protein
MFFDTQTLEKRRIPFEQSLTPGEMGWGVGLRQIGDLKAAGVAELLDPFGVREIHVRGRLTGEMEVECARCLEPVAWIVSFPLEAFYRPMSEIAREEEMAISEAETEVGFYEDEGIELAAVVRDQVMLELPMRSVCRPECRGLCPVCGNNRNLQACECREVFTDPRWESLRNWKA